MSDLDFSNPNPLAGIAMGIAQGMKEKNAKALEQEIKERDAIEKELEEIAKDSARYDEQSRQIASRYAMQLKLTPPHAKRPKQFMPDKNYNGMIPAIVESTARRIAKEGPAEPPEPQQPAEPQMGGGAAVPPMPEVPDFGAMFMQNIAQQPGGQNSMFASNPQPGGQKVGGNAITAAPAVPAMPVAAPPAAVSAAPAPAPMPTPGPGPADLPSGWESAARTDLEAAQHQAQIEGAKNAVSVPGYDQPIDSRALSTVRASDDRKVRLIGMGLDENGNQLPDNQIPMELRGKVALMRANQAEAEARADLYAAQAKGVPEEIDIKRRALEIAESRVEVARQALQRGVYPGSGGGAGGAMLPPRTVQQTINQIRGNFDNEPAVREYQTVASGYQFAKQLGSHQGAKHTSADDIGLIYAFAKAMDPGSVVREGEYSTVQKYAQAWSEMYGFNARRVISNSEFLTDAARRNLIAAIKGKYDVALHSYRNVEQNYKSIIDQTMQGGISGGLPDYAAAWESPAAGAPAPSAAPQQKPLGAFPPKEQRVKGVTKGPVINGKPTVWDGEAWATTGAK